MQFLNEVSRHADTNKMTIKNLAIVFAPNLMPLSESHGQRLALHVQIIEYLIENAYQLGMVPSSVLRRSDCSSLSSADSKVEYRGRTVSTASQNVKDKKKKRRSGSINRMFTGLRKIVGAFGSAENIEENQNGPATNSTPCINRKRKVEKEAKGLSAKKK